MNPGGVEVREGSIVFLVVVGGARGTSASCAEIVAHGLFNERLWRESSRFSLKSVVVVAVVVWWREKKKVLRTELAIILERRTVCCDLLERERTLATESTTEVI